MSADPSTFDLVAQSAAGRDHAAVVDAQGEFAYAALADAARRLATALAANTSPGARVVLLARNSRQYAAAMLGLEAAARVRVPLNFRSTAAEVTTVVADCAAEVLACDAATEPVARAGIDALPSGVPRPRIVRIDACDPVETFRDGAPFDRGAAFDRGAVDDRSDPHDPGPLALASISYTSGTLGCPKGVMMTSAQWQAVYRNLLSVRDFRSTDRIGLVGPLSHAAGAYLVPAWLAGATVVLLPSAKPADLAAALERHRLTVLQCVPTVLTRLVADDDFRRADRSSLRLVIYGAERMPPRTLDASLALFGPILAQNYGLTEAMMTCCTLHPHEHVRPDGRARIDAIGRPYPFVQLQIRRLDGACAAPGEVGEIAVRSPHVMHGYWRRPAETAAVLQDGWLRTGDLATVDDDGFVVLKGRAKDVVISGGTNIYPADVEAWLQRYPEFGEVAVFGVEDATWGERIVAAVALDAAGCDPRGYAAARERARRDLGMRCPKQWLEVPELPLTGNGKVDARALRALAEGR